MLAKMQCMSGLLEHPNANREINISVTTGEYEISEVIRENHLNINNEELVSAAQVFGAFGDRKSPTPPANATDFSVSFPR